MLFHHSKRRQFGTWGHEPCQKRARGWTRGADRGFFDNFCESNAPKSKEVKFCAARFVSLGPQKPPSEPDEVPWVEGAGF